MCEGTRFTKEKYEASVEVAKQKGLPVLKHHLLPRTKGFTLLASQLKGKVDYFYDLTLAVDNVNGSKPTLKHIVDGVPINFQFVLRRIPVSSVPIEDEKQCAEFVQKLYQEKVCSILEYFKIICDELIFVLKRMKYLMFMIKMVISVKLVYQNITLNETDMI